MVNIKQRKELIRYLIVGLSTTIINWLVYTPLVVLGFNITVANAVAWFVAVLFAFFTNKFFVFRSEEKQVKLFFIELFSFFGSRILTGIIEIVLPEFLVGLGLNISVFNIPGFVAKVATSIIVVVLNYILSKFFVFNKELDS